MIEKITDQNLERYDSRLKEWCDRKFFEKSNYGKYQTTEEASAVAFYPAPDTPLEGKVKFSFKETMPTNRDKGPDNPSTIMGISSITVTHCETEGVDSTDYTIQFGNTYYGGEIDLVTGVMTVTHTSVVFNGTETWYGGVQDSDQEYHGFACNVPSGPANLTQFCTHFDYANSLSTGFQHFVVVGSGVHFYATQETTTEFKTWLADQYTAGTPVTICYTLTTPYTIQLIPTQIYSLTQVDKYTPRFNTVYTDADSVQISYLKSPIRDEYEKTQAILSLGGNS